MTPHTELIDRYLAAWNETDSHRRRTLINCTWTEDSIYLDPVAQGAGRSGIDTMIGRVQKQFPGLKFRRTGNVDAHHGRLRFAWELGPEGGSPVAGGVDFGITRAGMLQKVMLQKVTGFIDFAPKPAAREER